MKQFYDELGEKRAKRIHLAVLDRWTAFYNATREAAPQAAILYDKSHVMGHLGEALDEGSRACVGPSGGRGR